MNLPRLFIDADLAAGKEFPLTRDQAHYLTRVMRISALPKELADSNQQLAKDNSFLVFNNCKEFMARLVENKSLLTANCYLLTEHTDPSNNLTFSFAPIKQSRMEEMLNAATQLGVAKLQPIITERTTERFPKWDRIRKIIVEASEQSGRNSVPELLPPIKFAEFLQNENIVFADERFAHNKFPSCGGVPAGRGGLAKHEKENINNDFAKSQTWRVLPGDCEASALSFPRRREPPQEGNLLIGPEGGFSPAEFAALDTSGATGISLGRTILRAEVAAIAALSLVINQ
jgi:16S rRNA (uracil1498-N3)-methyltransferase